MFPDSRVPAFPSLTGRGVRVAVVDSGIAPAHPHVGAVAGGVRLTPDGEDGDWADRIGHGTAVAAAIREKAPDAELVAVRVFDRSLVTSAEVLARAIRRAAADGARLVNLSLGTANPARAAVLRAAVDEAAERGALVVSARELDGVAWLPGALDGVAGVLLDWDCPRDQVVPLEIGGAGLAFRASGWPRPIPGVPRERNLSGISFAVANVTGFLARLLEADAAAATVRDLRRVLGRERPQICADRRG